MKKTKHKINRRQFLATTALGLSASALGATRLTKLSTNPGGKTMKATIHPADSRGVANHGWLNSHHSFSFASWYNPERMGFGLLRVINDDIIAPGTGFGTHPHKDMEIISIPISGGLKHKDSEGNEGVISEGEVQLMSAGTGVFHSEYNASEKDDANFLQIWVMPEKEGIKPRYDQKKFDLNERKNKFQTVVSPMDKQGDGVKINQQAYFSLVDLDADKAVDYQINQTGNGVYVFLIEGRAKVVDNELNQKDAIGLENLDSLKLTAKTNTKALVIEVPMS